MAIPDPIQHDWPADRALLLVHGIGNAAPGDYAPLEQRLAEILAPAKKPYAIYSLYYDYLNDWFAGKEQVGTLNEALRGELRKNISRDFSTAVDFIGDVIWPVLLNDARLAVQMALRRQLVQMVADARRSGINNPGQMHISIIAHSLGCFHTFETLHSMCADPQCAITPARSRLQFDNVIFMASPVGLIGEVGGWIRTAVPQSGNLWSFRRPYTMPSEPSMIGGNVDYAKRTVAITGKLDPVGGYFFNDRWDAAYMDISAVANDVQIDDPQTPLNINSAGDLEAILAQSLRDHAPPDISDRHPHSWNGYVDRHATELLQWLDV